MEDGQVKRISKALSGSAKAIQGINTKFDLIDEHVQKMMASRCFRSLSFKTLKVPPANLYALVAGYRPARPPEANGPAVAVAEGGVSLVKI